MADSYKLRDSAVGGTLRVSVTYAVLLWITTISVCARDCSVSKEFQIKHSQVIAGHIQDPAGLVLAGIELDLLSGKTVAQHLRTNNQGAYDFGEIPAGRYKLRVQSGGDVFCAPKIKCGTDGCTLEPGLTLNPKNAVTVY